MRNQFFYTRTVQTQAEGTEGAENLIISSYRDSINLDMVIRSVTLPSGEVVVLLNDTHIQFQQNPIMDTKKNAIKSYKEVRSTVQSEITLSIEDGKRFFLLTNAEDDSKVSHAVERAEILSKANMAVTE